MRTTQLLIHRSVICTQAFAEFTAKPLPTTYTHLSVMTRNPLADSVLEDNEMILVEDYRLPVSPECLDLESRNSRPTPSRLNKVLHVTLRGEDESLTTNLTDPILTVSQNISDSKSVYESYNQTDSFHCYQLPFVFKGVQFRNKTLV